MKKKYKATVALAISIAGAAGTSTIAHTGFAGGMVHNGFLAATIGGLADWFAVTALFRKPLGISYRTEIIIRNRQRIMDAVVDFAANDLLGADNVMKFVDRQDLSAFLQVYLRQHGDSKVLPYAAKIGQLAERAIVPRQIAEKLTPLVENILEQGVTRSMVTAALTELAQEENARQFLHVLAAGGEVLLADDELKDLLAEYIEKILQDYSKEAGSRSFMIGMLGLTGQKLADILQEKGKNWLDSLAEDSELEARYTQLLGEKLLALAETEKSGGKLAAAFADWGRGGRVTDLLEHFISHWQQQGLIADYVQQATAAITENFLRDINWQEQADAAMKGWLAKELRGHHDVIVNIIRERLNRFSDEELVSFTEEKVADDLQMIRINGSVVGSLVGMALYAVVYAAGQVLSP